MKPIKSILALLSVVLLFSSCHRTFEKVIASWPDGSKQVVQIYQGSEKHPQLVAEQWFYPDGKLHADKHYNPKTGARTGEWKFYHPDGNIFAQGNFSHDSALGNPWSISDRAGNSPCKAQYDSMAVTQLGEAETPATILYFIGEKTQYMQFFSDGSPRATGLMVNGFREGRWVFYFANGQPQTEATFKEGREDGTYTVFRENGIPYYRGQYCYGARCGIWEFYDADGNLMEKKDFDMK